jgi:hypothetical protein
MVVAAATGVTVTVAVAVEVEAAADVAVRAEDAVREAPEDLAVRARAAVPEVDVVRAVADAGPAVAVGVPVGRAAVVDVVVRGQADPAEGRADALSKACQAP